MLPTTKWAGCALNLHIMVRDEERTHNLWFWLCRNLLVIDLGPGSSWFSNVNTPQHWNKAPLLTWAMSEELRVQAKLNPIHPCRQILRLLRRRPGWVRTSMGRTMRHADFPNGSKILLLFSDTLVRVENWDLYWYVK